MLSQTSVRDRIESVRAMIHELEDQELFDEDGHEIAARVDEELAALAEKLDDSEWTPPLFI